jgi:hypothetical protein
MVHINDLLFLGDDQVALGILSSCVIHRPYFIQTIFFFSLMDIHHNTSFESILEDDSIFSTFKAYICSCLGKGAGLWLIVKPSIYSFWIAHFTFTLTLHFCFSLIQHSTSNFFSCECGHGLNASNTPLTHCPFEG